MPAVVTGFTHDILDNGTREDGKILNGLEFPMWKDTHWDHSSFATDLVAWDYVKGKENGGHPTPPYPIEHVRWGLAGTANTVTYMHLDSDGFATFVQVMCGKKVWAIYRPAGALHLSSPSVFLHNGFRLDSIPENASFAMEAVVLRQGDLL